MLDAVGDPKTDLISLKSMKIIDSFIIRNSPSNFQKDVKQIFITSTTVLSAGKKILVPFTNSLTSYRLNVTEWQALKILYNSTNGFDWVWSRVSFKWNFSDTFNDPCIWEGITCVCDVNKNCFIHKLVLDHHNLKGSVPVTINLLSELIYLDISNNYLTGSIPDFQLYNLECLMLNNNLFSGQIPTFKSLNQLQKLYLSNNLHLDSTIPGTKLNSFIFVILIVFSFL